jgi:hypothetical protein
LTQDLALFLARARSLGGTFFLDEPASHLDDLNRVALLNIFRALAVERGTDVSLQVAPDTGARDALRVEHVDPAVDRHACPLGPGGYHEPRACRPHATSARRSASASRMIRARHLD